MSVCICIHSTAAQHSTAQHSTGPPVTRSNPTMSESSSKKANWLGWQGWERRSHCCRGWRLLHWGPLTTVWLVTSIVACGQIGLRGYGVATRFLGWTGLRDSHEPALLVCIALPVAYFFVLSLFSDPGFVRIETPSSGRQPKRRPSSHTDADTQPEQEGGEETLGSRTRAASARKQQETPQQEGSIQRTNKGNPEPKSHMIAPTTLTQRRATAQRGKQQLTKRADASDCVPPALSLEQRAHCRHCEQAKPPRAHHCRRCGRCVQKMDHHCPWINNCVGYHNQRIFLLFVSAAHFGTLLYAVWFLARLFTDSTVSPVYAVHVFLLEHLQGPHRFVYLFDVWQFIYVFYGLCASAIVSVGTGLLLFDMLISVHRNTTMLEEWVLGSLNERRERQNPSLPPLACPYDLGWRRNLLFMLGGNPLRWLWPWRSSASRSGTYFQVRNGCDQQTMLRYELEARSYSVELRHLLSEEVDDVDPLITRKSRPTSSNTVLHETNCRPSLPSQPTH